MKPDTAITSAQLHILKHSIGWPKDYRNHFSTGPGSKDFDDCEALVKLGLMDRRTLSFVPDNIYTVTVAGRKAIEEYTR